MVARAAPRSVVTTSFMSNWCGVGVNTVSSRSTMPQSRRFMSTDAGGDAATSSPEVNDVVYEIDQTQFQKVVMMSEVPVILDCYADWCGPCKQLAPLLEKAVRAAGGRVHLAKLNTDNNPQLSQGLRVQSLPTVLTIFQGKLVENFVGMQPEAEIEAYVERAAALAGAEKQETAESAYLKASEALSTATSDDTTPEDAASAYEAARTDFQQALELGNLSADASDGEKITAACSYAGLIRVSLGTGDIESANQLADAIRAAYPSYLKVPEVSQALSALHLAQPIEEDGDVAELRAKVASDPDDLQSRLLLANALVAAGSHAAAIDECLTVVGKDASWDNGAAQQLLLKVFDALGGQHELTVAGRKRLASLLFR